MAATHGRNGKRGSTRKRGQGRGRRPANRTTAASSRRSTHQGARSGSRSKQRRDAHGRFTSSSTASPDRSREWRTHEYEEQRRPPLRYGEEGDFAARSDRWDDERRMEDRDWDRRPPREGYDEPRRYISRSRFERDGDGERRDDRFYDDGRWAGRAENEDREEWSRSSDRDPRREPSSERRPREWNERDDRYDRYDRFDR